MLLALRITPSRRPEALDHDAGWQECDRGGGRRDGSLYSRDMVFGLIGANAPIMKVHFKCI
jgi:hypothetical protein